MTDQSKSTEPHDAAFDALYKKRMLTANDLCGLAMDIGLSDKSKEIKQNQSVNVGMRLVNRNDPTTCKRLTIEAKGYSPYGLSQFDVLKAIENGWKPLKPLTEDDYDEKKRSRKGWNLNIEVEKSPDFDSLNSVSCLALRNILGEVEVKRRFGKRFHLETKSWVKEKEDGNFINMTLNPQITQCIIANSQTKKIRKVEFAKFPKKVPGWYSFKMRWDHVNITELTTTDRNLKIFNPIWYVQTVIYHESEEEVIPDEDDEFEGLKGFETIKEVEKKAPKESIPLPALTDPRLISLPHSLHKQILHIANQEYKLDPPGTKLKDLTEEFIVEDEYGLFVKEDKLEDLKYILGQLANEYTRKMLLKTDLEIEDLKMSKLHSDAELFKKKRLLHKEALEKLEKKKRKVGQSIEATESKEKRVHFEDEQTPDASEPPSFKKLKTKRGGKDNYYKAPEDIEPSVL